MTSSGLEKFNELQVFTYDVGELLNDHNDYAAYQAKLTRVLANADPSPFIQAVTAFQFAKLFAKDPDLQDRLDELEEQLFDISEFYQSRIHHLEIGSDEE